MSDLKIALRSLLKAPGSTLVAVLSLALGIGAITTVLCWMENLVVRPLPGVEHQENLVIVTSSQSGRMSDTTSLLDIREIATLQDIF
ncbi:MAG TPA: permease, partial [Candidatus Didemnitutus sp.]|nr:permease [Candidatus Didemnitutus sp.]